MNNINQTVFPAVQEGDRILWEDNKWYVYIDGTWVEETN